MSQPTAEGGQASALRPMVRHPYVTLLAVSLLGLVGLGIGLATPGVYRAETRLVVAPASNSSYVIAGYPLAARDLAANYSRFVQNGASDTTWMPAEVSRIHASPIPDSAVIRIEAESMDPRHATAGAEQVASQLTTQVRQQQQENSPTVALAEYEKLAPQVAAAQAAVENARTSKARQDARVALASVQLRRDAYGERYRRLFSDPQVTSGLQVIQPAQVVSYSRNAVLVRWLMIGVGTGLAVALVATTLMERRRASLRHGEAVAVPVTPGPQLERNLPLAR